MNIKNALKILKPVIDRLAVPIYSLRKVPFSLGYDTFKWQLIEKIINNDEILAKINGKFFPEKYGIGLDERAVEYPWLFSNISEHGFSILDAGSTFNFKPIISHPFFDKKKLHIYTFYPENKNYPSDKVIYEYGDLRSLPYQINSFDIVVSHSTIEHIDMDNSIYGYKLSHNRNEQIKSYEYLIAIQEYLRVLSPNGQLLLTFPFGRFKNYGFFQQFDTEMVNRILGLLGNKGTYNVDYLLYSQKGWKFADEKDCISSLSHNPHTKEDKGSDGAAHCRSICCINFIKNI